MATTTKRTKNANKQTSTNSNAHRDYPMTWSRPLFDWLAARTVRFPGYAAAETREGRVGVAVSMMTHLGYALAERCVTDSGRARIAVAAFGEKGEPLGIVDVPAANLANLEWRPADVPAAVWPLRPHVAIVLLTQREELTPAPRTRELLTNIRRRARDADIAIEDVVMVGFGGPHLSLATVGLLEKLT